MRTLQYLTLALLCWFTLGWVIELNRVPRLGAVYFFGFGLDLLLVVFSCIVCAALWTKSQRLRALPMPLKALISFAVPFLAGLPIVVGQWTDPKGKHLPVYFRHWDFDRIVFSRPAWPVIAVQLFVTALFATALFLVIRRVETRRPETGRRTNGGRGWSFVAVMAIVCADLIVVRQYFLAMAANRPDYSGQHELAIGTVIPAFELKDTDGRTIKHDPADDRILLVNFFATWCPPCQRELPHLQKIWEENRNAAGFSMAVIGLGEPNHALVQFKKDNGYTMPFVSDEDECIYNLFGLDGAIPHTCLLQNGTVRLSIRGYDENRVQRLRQHLQISR